MPLYEPQIAARDEPEVNGYRLTGVSGTPVMVTDNASLSTIYLTPYTGDRIALFNGTSWDTIYGSEVSLAVTGRTADLPFDIFAYSNAGALAIEFLNWSTATARATGLTRVDGVYTKTSDSTRRFVGTCRPRAATTYSFVTTGLNAPARLDLWNYANRVRTGWQVTTNVDTWTYTTATWRQAQASTNYQVDVVAGVEENVLDGRLVVASMTNSAVSSIERACAFGVDSTTVPSGAYGFTASQDSITHEHSANIVAQIPIGRHFVAWLEISGAGGTSTWYGDNGGNRPLTGMVGGWFT